MQAKSTILELKKISSTVFSLRQPFHLDNLLFFKKKFLDKFSPKMKCHKLNAEGRKAT
jgi:hypothetical protein